MATVTVTATALCIHMDIRIRILIHCEPRTDLVSRRLHRRHRHQLPINPEQGPNKYFFYFQKVLFACGWWRSNCLTPTIFFCFLFFHFFNYIFFFFLLFIYQPFLLYFLLVSQKAPYLSVGKDLYFGRYEWE
jgi:hypothetical protein